MNVDDKLAFQRSCTKRTGIRTVPAAVGVNMTPVVNINDNNRPLKTFFDLSVQITKEGDNLVATAHKALHEILLKFHSCDNQAILYTFEHDANEHNAIKLCAAEHNPLPTDISGLVKYLKKFRVQNQGTYKMFMYCQVGYTDKTFLRL